jgi:hypothetical protein
MHLVHPHVEDEEHARAAGAPAADLQLGL